MKFAVLPGSNGDYMSTPDAAAFSALGDFSVLAAVVLNDWTPAVKTFLMEHAGARSWDWTVETSGKFGVELSNNNIAYQTQVTSSAATGIADGTASWVAVMRDRAGGTIKFYTATFVAGSVVPPAIGSFTQLGTTVTGAITTTLNDGTDVLAAGADGSGGGNTIAGKLYREILYSGIYGSGSEAILRDCNPNSWTGGTTWVAATSGETWTLNGNARVVNDALRAPAPHLVQALQRGTW